MHISMRPGEIELLKKLVSDSENYLEFGMGGSTLLAVNSGVRTTSVESDTAWIGKVKASTGQGDAAATLLTTYHADIGPTREWGLPVSSTPDVRWANYYLGVWKLLATPPDFVLVDG